MKIQGYPWDYLVSILKKYVFNNKTDLRTINHSCALFNIYIKYISSNHKDQYTDFLEYFSKIEYDDYNFSDLIDICIKYRLFQYLDYIIPVYDVISYINTKYNLNMYKNTKGTKIYMKLINAKCIDK